MYQVKVIADSVSDAARVTSFQVTYPRFILAEVNTHRIIAKSTESSRAVPVRKRISAVLSDPFVPLAFGKNQSGMQARETLEGLKHTVSRWAWLGAAFTAAGWASILDRLGVHKQLANRIVEPYVWVTTVLTATEWDNFWALRTHPDAQPEFQTLACMMREAYDASKPHPKQLGEWHLPYIQRSEMLGPSASVIEWQDLARASAARCGRVSYRPHDGSDVDLAKDMARALGFNDGGHMGPFDHPARAGMIDVRATKHSVQRLVGGSEDWTRNAPRMLDTNDFVAHLRGWTPLRRFIPYEYNFGLYKKAQEALKSQAERTAVNAAS